VKKIGKTPFNRSARYITDDFVEAVATAISEYPLPTGHRNLFYGGGEPLINPPRFGEINQAFDQAEKTTQVVITNGLALPIQEEEFIRFVKKAGNPYIMLTYTENHAGQYTALAKSKKDLSKWIPKIKPTQALIEKTRILNHLCKKHNIGFSVNIVYPNGKHPPQELRNLILEGAEKSLKYVNTDMNGHRNPCSKSKETSKSYKKLLGILKNINKSFVIYGFDKNYKDENLIFRKFNEKQFLKDLSECKAVITNGGFNLICEAIYLKKPILSLPIKHQFEQILNALYVQKLEYGEFHERADESIINKFILNLNIYEKNLQKHKKQKNSELLNKLERVLKRHSKL